MRKRKTAFRTAAMFQREHTDVLTVGMSIQTSQKLRYRYVQN
jgi:hypothetical protein